MVGYGVDGADDVEEGTERQFHCDGVEKISSLLELHAGVSR